MLSEVSELFSDIKPLAIHELTKFITVSAIVMFYCCVCMYYLYSGNAVLLTTRVGTSTKILFGTGTNQELLVGLLLFDAFFATATYRL